MTLKITDPEIKKIIEKLHQRFPDMEFFKVWDEWEETKTNTIGRNGTHYVKAFTKPAYRRWLAELKLINKFNKFAKDKNQSFSWPSIVTTNTKWFLYYVMEDITHNKNKLKLSDQSIDETLEMFDEYRNTFDSFEEYSQGAITKNTYPRLQKDITDMRKIQQHIKLLEQKLLLLKRMTKSKITEKYKAQITQWIEAGKKTVKLYSASDIKKLTKKHQELRDDIQDYNFDYTHGMFWSWHIFKSKEENHYQLVDFDRIGYQLTGSELIGLLWSHTLLKVDKFTTYASWKKSTTKRIETIKERLQNDALLDFLLFHKLIGTIFYDFGVIQPNKADQLTADGVDTKKYLKKGVEWNGKLLEELYFTK